MTSTAATVAATIRKHLKANGIVCRVTKSSYDCVRVTVYDQLPATVAKIEEYCGQFKSGYFDGMTDCFMYDPNKGDMTVKYIFIDNELSQETRHKCRDFVASYYASSCDLEDMYWQELGGRISQNFWRTMKPRIAA